MKSFFTKSILVANVFICLFLQTNISNAQTTVIIGANSGANATNTYPCSLGDYYTSQRAQYLYRVADFAAAGITSGAIINQIGWVEQVALL